MDLDELNEALARSNARARKGRTAARVGFVVTVALVAMVLYVFATAPRCMCPMFDKPPDAFGLPVGDVTLGVAFAGLAAGLIWMWRIVRADGDPGSRSWRLLRRH